MILRAKASAGVGVEVTEEEVAQLVRAAADELESKIKEKGYHFTGPFRGQLKSIQGLKFANPEFVVKASSQEFERFVCYDRILAHCIIMH